VLVRRPAVVPLRAPPAVANVPPYFDQPRSPCSNPPFVKTKLGPVVAVGPAVGVRVGVAVLVGVGLEMGDALGVVGVADGKGLGMRVAVVTDVAVEVGVAEGGGSGVVSSRLSMHSTAGAVASTESAMIADSGWKPMLVLTEKCV
jgi:hypothetical protein